MPWNPGRRTIRIAHFDYATPGYYFVTICSHLKRCHFGEIRNGNLAAAHLGVIVSDAWISLPQLHPSIGLDEWVLMPNHLHGIIYIQETINKECPNPLGQIICTFKSRVTTNARKILNRPGLKVWQRNYWERVIRNESELDITREYIRNNPAKWELDKLNPNSLRI
jgi:putative transposase